MKQIGSDDARTMWRDLLNEVEHGGEHVAVLRYKKPAVMIVPVEWYEKAKAALSDA